MVFGRYIPRLHGVRVAVERKQCAAAAGWEIHMPALHKQTDIRAKKGGAVCVTMTWKTQSIASNAAKESRRGKTCSSTSKQTRLSVRIASKRSF